MNNKRKTSEVWNYFTPEESDYIATCHICKKKFRYRTSTTNLKKHFVKKHPEYLSSGSHVVPMDQDAKIEEHEEQSGEITANLIDLESLKIPNINQFLPENFGTVDIMFYNFLIVLMFSLLQSNSVKIYILIVNICMYNNNNIPNKKIIN